MADGRPAVQKGGFWGSPQGQYSPQTQHLLKEMMKESKLTNFQQRQLQSTLRSGDALPAHGVNPTTSAKPKQPRAKAPLPKVLNPRNYSGGVRLREQIEDSGVYERPDYKPPPKVGRTEKDKQRLANIMAYGEDLPRPTKEKLARRIDPSPEPEPDRFDELQQEVAERQQFLDEMETIGKGAHYRTIIATEISQKVRDMEVIDKKRTMELEKMIKEDERQKRSTQKQSMPQATVTFSDDA